MSFLSEEQAALPALDPLKDYTAEELRPYSVLQIEAWARAAEDIREGLVRPHKSRGIEMNTPPAIPPKPRYLTPAPAQREDLEMTITSPGVRKSTALALRGKPVALAAFSGDKQMILSGYKSYSLCNMITRDAVERAYAAVALLDDEHANIIKARLMKAGISNGNASHVSQKEITFKKAVSIALQAERWVYEAQAAAAKSMVKESKHCLHKMAGKRRRTVDEKEATYAAKYGIPRGTRKERAIRKKQKQLSKLTGAE